MRSYFFLFIMLLYCNVLGYSQAPIQTICNEQPEFELEPLGEVSLELILEDEPVEVNANVGFRITPNFYEYAIDYISFSQPIDSVLAKIALERTLAGLVVANPAEFGEGEWRLKVPACWAAIFDYCFELYACVGNRSCITYSFDMRFSEDCAETVTYSNFRQNEYDLCRYSEEPCQAINKINLKRGLSRIISGSSSHE